MGTLGASRSLLHHGGEGLGHAGIEMGTGIPENHLNGDDVRRAASVRPVWGYLSAIR
jgi:hypothetical protein